MVKLSSRDVIDVLRRFKQASDDIVPRQIEMIKMTNPEAFNTLFSFNLKNSKYYVLLDDTANDDVNYVLSQIKTVKQDIAGELINNPKDDTTTYAMPYKGKECYLFKEVSTKKRLDVVLAERDSKYSRSTWQKYIKSGYVSVNNKVITSPKYDISADDEISVNISLENDFSKNELPILYIDDNVIVVNKPIGILSHSKGVLNDEFTVADFFRRYSNYNLDTNRPGIVHRLDRDTSGVIIGARNIDTAKMLQKQFSERKTKKVYYAIIDGKPRLSKAKIDLPIKRSASKPSTFLVDVNGKPAITNYEIISTVNNKSLVKLEPQTGRTHQLRVHMKYLNTPIIGDRVYGKESDRMYLHAYSLEITIPTYGRKTFKAPIPTEMLKLFPKVDIT